MVFKFPWRKGTGTANAGSTLPPHLAMGQAGEEAAARRLWREGYRILARNFRCTGGEIDIIAEKDRIIYFVEVKTRGGDAGAEMALSAVDEVKRGRIRHAARVYLKSFDDESIETRYKVITVEMDSRHRAATITMFDED